MPGSRAADPVIIVWANITIFVRCYLVLPIFFWLGFSTKIFIEVVGCRLCLNRLRRPWLGSRVTLGCGENIQRSVRHWWFLSRVEVVWHSEYYFHLLRKALWARNQKMRNIRAMVVTTGLSSPDTAPWWGPGQTIPPGAPSGCSHSHPSPGNKQPITV